MIFTSPFESPASHTHPLPNWPTPAALNFSWKVLNGTGRIASTLGLHDVPEHGVVDVAAAVVADGAADVFWDCVQVAKQIFRSFFVQLGMLVEGRVQVFDVGGVMHVVMQVHRLFVDGGFERRVIVRQGGQFMRHFHFLQSLCHFLFLQSLRDVRVWLKDSCGTGLVAATAPYICNILEGQIERRECDLSGLKPHSSQCSYRSAEVCAPPKIKRNPWFFARLRRG